MLFCGLYEFCLIIFYADFALTISHLKTERKITNSLTNYFTIGSFYHYKMKMLS